MGVLFDVIDITEDMILGKPWLAKHNPTINYKNNQWRWELDESKLEVVTPEDFVNELYESEVYTLIYKADWPNLTRFDANSASSGHINEVAAEKRQETFPLPEYLKDFKDVFDVDAAAMLPHRGKFDHAIVTTADQDPPYGPLYNLSQTELKVLRDYLEEATKRGWIRRSTSPAGAPILFVKKKNNAGLRLCVDYRGLNKITIKNRHPLPLISETLDRLQGSKVFTKLDLKDAYYRIRIREGDEWKTAFRTRYGHFEYLIMPFGLANAPATFQAYISQALVGLVDISCVVYMDDILIYTDDDSGSLWRHHEHVKEVLVRLRKFKLYANIKKCEFDTDRVEFLGFVVNTKGISMEPSRVDSITGWPAPRNFKELQSFLGFANFYRRFIDGYSKSVRPLTDMLKGMQAGVKTRHFVWTMDQQESFDLLKRKFTEAPVLTHFDPQLPILLETDASGFAIGAVLSQRQDRYKGILTSAQWHPIAFYSRKMTDAETRYETHDGELLAIVEAFRHWRHYLEGSQWPVVVRTDHNSLKHFMTQKQLNRRQARWAERLAAFDFTIEYRTGKTNPADGPSRRPDYNTESFDHAKQLLPTLQRKLLVTGPNTISDLESMLVRGRSQVDATTISVVTATKNQFSHEEMLHQYHKWIFEESSTPEWGSGGLTPAYRRITDCDMPVTPYSEYMKFFKEESCRINSVTAGSVGKTYGRVPGVQPFDLRHIPESGISAIEGMNPFYENIGELESPSTPRRNKDAAMDEIIVSDCVKAADSNRYDQSRSDDSEPDEEAECTQSTSRLLINLVTRDIQPYDEPSESLTDLIKAAQKIDPFTVQGDWKSKSQRYCSESWSLRKDGILTKDGKAYIPKDASLRAEIMRLCHDDPHSSHFGTAKTLKLIQRYYYWESMAAEVKEYVLTCDRCQRTKSARHRPYGELASLPHPGGPWQEISMDFITDLPPSPGDGQYWDSILVIVDRYTKMSLYIAVKKTITAEELATSFLRRVASVFGIPKGIVSDRGSVFTSKFWSSLCYHFKIKRRLSTAFHPQTDGQTERQNQTLEHYLRCYTNYRQTDWYDKLPLAEFTYNNSEHSTTRMTPFYALYGYHPDLRLHVQLDEETNIPEADLRIARVRDERGELEIRWRAAVEAQQRGYNRRHVAMTFAVGDEVMVNARHIRQLRQSKKLSDKYLGPFKVVTVLGEHKQAYKIELPRDYRIHPVFHVSLLEKYRRRPGDDSITKPGKLDIENEDFWEVETILAHRDKGIGREYLVRWKDWPPSEDSWEPKENFSNQKLIRKYNQQVDGDKRPELESSAKRRQSGRVTQNRK